jgi:hypothetical protein
MGCHDNNDYLLWISRRIAVKEEHLLIREVPLSKFGLIKGLALNLAYQGIQLQIRWMG